MRESVKKKCLIIYKQYRQPEDPQVLNLFYLGSSYEISYSNSSIVSARRKIIVKIMIFMYTKSYKSIPFITTVKSI